jgi:hypothetical protein
VVTNEFAPLTRVTVPSHVVPTNPHPCPCVLSNPKNEEVTSVPFSFIVALGLAAHTSTVI